MYRIIFNPNTASWQVELQLFGFWWKPIMGQVEGSKEPVLEPQRFPDFNQANEYVNKVGLSKVYRNWNDRPAHHIMQSTQMHQATSGY